MNIKQIIALVGITLFSFNALSIGQFRINLGDLEIDAAAHKLPREAILGNGWKQFESTGNQELCVAEGPGNFNFIPQVNSQPVGTVINDSSGSYPVFSTGINGVGYVMALRQKGTSQWYPLTGNNSEISAIDGSSSLQLETRMMYVKTVQGDIEGTDKAVTHFNPVKVQCSGDMNWISSVGEILPASTLISWAQRTCAVSSVRQSVDLGVHDIAKVRSLNIGDTFGHAQQSITINCPAIMSVAYTIADNLHPSNINTDIIYLENESESPGFAVRVYEAGQSSPLKLGGDRTLSNNYVYSLLDKASLNPIVTKTFEFRYVKTSNEVKATHGNAQVTVTLVYK
ncbi:MULTISPECIES: fimbrial protein [Providencia]|uniref:fimbrial protein n=1 Tax=Providencia TaxID=586 RepID=UPI000F794B27|nr:fimbrial protein [Providencia stuartii]MBV2189856.1 fimbrial protein [Providencia rettgeri]